MIIDNTLLNKARRHLHRADPVMSRLIKSHKPYFSDKSSPGSNHYHTLVKTIINQQLSVKAAQTIESRLQKLQGGRSFNTKKLHALTDDAIRDCGISRNKTRYIRAITQAVIDKELNFKKLEKQDDDTITESLIKYPGIGQWSVDMFLMSSFNRLDIFPLGDLVIRKSMQRHYKLEKDCSHDKYLKVARAWQPYRTVASRYLWSAYTSSS